MTEIRLVRAAEGATAPGAPWRWLASAGDTDGRFDFMVGTVAYRSGPPLHVHDDQHDTFFVLRGVLTVRAGDDVVELRAGDFVTVPPGVPHTFDNLHEGEETEVVNLMVPGGLLDYFTASAAAGDETADRVARAHGVTIVGPPLHGGAGRP